MVDLAVALAWIAMSAVSLKWLVAFERMSAASGCGEDDPALLAGGLALAHEESHPLDLWSLPAGGPR